MSHALARPLLFCLGAILSAALLSCEKPAKPVAPATTTGPLVQRAYLWQRDWTRQVSQSAVAHAGAFDFLDLLAAQVEWREPSAEPSVIRPAIDWSSLRSTAKPAGLVVRVHRAGEEAAVAEAVTRLLLDRLAEARAASVPVSEFQIDYDCPQKRLADYHAWLVRVREELRSTGIPLRITTLPSWLGEPAFAPLVDVTDGYVLQVHSFDLTTLGKPPTVCDLVMAREWVARAAKLGRPFHVALPTYRCLAGYAPDGRCLGMAADAGSPPWPSGTRILEFSSDPDALAALVAEWTEQRPALMQGLYWYRLPIEGESRNWRWPTLAAVMAGRAPTSKWEVRANVSNPTDFVLWNLGEKDGILPQKVVITWSGPRQLAVADALGGWTCQSSPGRIEFRPAATGAPLRLPPETSMPLGWIRYDETPAADIPFSYDIVR